MPVDPSVPSVPLAPPVLGRPTATGDPVRHDRAGLLDRVVAALATPPAGTAVVLVEGAAGSGLTTLLTECVRRAAPARAFHATATGRASLQLLTDALGGTAVADALRESLAHGEDPCRHARLTARLGAWSAREAGTHGVVLVVDDAHRADPASVAVLCALLRDPAVHGLTVVLGARTGRLAPELRGAAGESALTLAVPAWDDVAVRTAVPGVSAVRARALCAAGLGRPALVLSLVGFGTGELRRLERLGVAQVAEATASSPAARWPRVDGLDPADGEVAATAAVLGTDVDVERVVEVSGRERAEVLAAIGRLVVAELVCEQAGRLRFGHPVLRAAAYRLVGVTHRRDLHRRAADVLAADGATVLDVAEHLAVAARPGDTGAFEALVGAAERRVVADPATAARWAEAALRLARDPADPALDRARLALAAAYVRGGRLVAGREIARSLVTAGDHPGRAALLLARCERALGAPSVARSLLRGEVADRRLPAPARADIELELLASEVFLPAVDDDPVETATDDAPTCAGRVARDVLRLGRAVLGPDAAVPAADLRLEADRVADLVDGLPNRTLAEVADHLPVLIWTELRLDLPDRATGHADRALLAAVGRDELIVRLLVVRAVLASRRGQLHRAVELADEAEEIATGLGLDSLVAITRAVALAPRLWTGGPATTGPALRVSDTPVLLDGADRFVALAQVDVLHQSGRRDDARSLLGAVLDSLPDGAADAAATRALGMTVEIGAGDLDAARALWDVVRDPSRAANHHDTAGVALAGAALACAEARWDDARDLAAGAVRGFERAGAPIAAARARLRLAEAARLSGDLDTAAQQIGLAKRVFQLHGAEFLVAVAVTAQKRAAASQGRRLDAGQFGLSTREAEIAELVCRGLTNRSIAQQLFLSVRTVDSHVARILSKVGVGSRVTLVGMFPAASIAS